MDEKKLSDKERFFSEAYDAIKLKRMKIDELAEIAKYMAEFAVRRSHSGMKVDRDYLSWLFTELIKLNG